MQQRICSFDIIYRIPCVGYSAFIISSYILFGFFYNCKVKNELKRKNYC